VLGVDNMKAGVAGCESLHGVAESGGDFVVADVLDGFKSVRAKNRCDGGRGETGGGTFTHFLKLLGSLHF
jgi:hypothetical protein